MPVGHARSSGPSHAVAALLPALMPPKASARWPLACFFAALCQAFTSLCLARVKWHKWQRSQDLPSLQPLGFPAYLHGKPQHKGWPAEPTDGTGTSSSCTSSTAAPRPPFGTPPCMLAMAAPRLQAALGGTKGPGGGGTPAV